MSTVVASGRPCLLVGDPGTSKTVTASSSLGSLDAGTNAVLAMAFSSTTSSADVQRALDERTEKRTKVGGKGCKLQGRLRAEGGSLVPHCAAWPAVAWVLVAKLIDGDGLHARFVAAPAHNSLTGWWHLFDARTIPAPLALPPPPRRSQDTYGPPSGKRLLLFLDDLNMPRLDTYGTQQPLALLKMFVERRGMYERGKGLGWRNVKDVQVWGRRRGEYESAQGVGGGG